MYVVEGFSQARNIHSHDFPTHPSRWLIRAFLDATVNLLTPPSPSLLEPLLKEEGWV